MLKPSRAQTGKFDGSGTKRGAGGIYSLGRQRGTFRKGETIDLVNINKVDITAIKPTIVVSPGATVAPASRQPVDLTTPKTYVVTASDGTTTKYTVSIRPKGESK